MKYNNNIRESILSNLNSFSENIYAIYLAAIEQYHVLDDLEQPAFNPYEERTIEYLFYKKCWVDTEQWHMEDEVRKPDIDLAKALQLKRSIDRSNQKRTDLVEQIDSYFQYAFRSSTVREDAKVNSETPAWALDRLSILALKIFHMKNEVNRHHASSDHLSTCNQKLLILEQQKKDLSLSINELLKDISEGTKRLLLYKQMKMYNDPNLNPVLYSSAAKAVI